MVDVRNIGRPPLITPLPHCTFLGTESGKPIDSNPDFSAFGFVIGMKASFFVGLYVFRNTLTAYMYLPAPVAARSKA